MKKTLTILLALVLALSLGLALAAPVSADPDPSTIAVSQPVQVTSDNYYERGQSIVYDGSDYWLFYGKSESCTDTYGAGNPDINDYVVYYKKASTVAGLAAATPTAISGVTYNTNIYLGETDAAYFDGEVWAFAAHHDGSKGQLYAWTTTDGSSWTENLVASDLSGGAAHFAAATCDGKLWVAYQLGNNWDSKYYDGSSWSSAYDITDKYGTAKFYVEDTGLYFVRAQGGHQDIHEWNGSSWSQLDSASETGAYDPTIYKIGSDYVWAYAPWVSPKQWIKAKVGTDLSTLLSAGSEVMISAAEYGGNTWIDMWPIGFLDDDGDTYLLFTSERNPSDPSSEIAGNIWYLEVDWTVTDDHYTYIRNAVDAADPGDTIEVGAGTYEEQITVDKNLTILGIDSPTIEAPDTRTTRTISGSGTRVLDWVVLIEDVEEFTFDGFIVDGKEDGTSVRFVGLLVGNSGGTISGNEVINVRGPEGGTGGIAVYGEHSVVDIEGNEVRDFRKNGITAVLDAAVNISGNTVVGDGPIDTIAQNGIQIGFGASGNITGNDVSAIFYSGEGWTATGILVVEAVDGVLVEGNNLDACQSGIVFEPYGATINNIIVRGNEVRDCYWGIYNGWSGALTGDRLIEDNELFDNYDGISLFDADGWLITGNTVDGSTTYGIGILGASNNITAEFNTITNNDVGVLVGNDGYGDPVDIFVNFNDITGNTAFGVEVLEAGAPNEVDGTYNWWGHNSGPYHEILNPDGEGDAVSDNVDFFPWLDKENPTVATKSASAIGTDSATLNMAYTVGEYETEVRFAWKKAADGAWSYTGWVFKTSDGTHAETLTGLDADTTYDFKAQLKYDTTEIEGGHFQFTTDRPPPPPPAIGCWIATAAYGSPSAEEINILREFRDVVLLESEAGSRFVTWYYQTSPPIADFIAGNEVLRTLVRELLVDPVVWLVESTGPAWRN